MVAALLAAAPAGAQSASMVEQLLMETLGFSADQVRSLRAGATVVRSLDTRMREELAHVGVVYLDASVAQFVERFRDIERFERGTGVPAIGRFSDPPRLEDLDALSLADADVAALRTCRAGDCSVKLPAAAMARFRDAVDWSSAEPAQQANALNRQMIFDLLQAYRAHGNAALGHYDDGDRPLVVAEHVVGLLASDDPLPAPVPALLAYLEHYPEGRPEGVEEFFYWTVVNFGLKPTVRLSHVAMIPLDANVPPGVSYAIAIKQLYASHYFHATLELRFLVEDDGRQPRLGTWLVSVTRSRNDGMTGFRSLFLRPIIARRSREGVAGYMEHVKRQVESSAPGESVTSD